MRKSNKQIVKSYITSLLLKGKKIKSEKLFFDLLVDIKEQKDFEQVPMSVLLTALRNIDPCLTLVSKKVGGSVYQVPVALRESEEGLIGVRWLFGSIWMLRHKSAKNKLLDSIFLSSKNEGDLVKKKEVLYQTAVKNRAFLKLLV